jgi:hypothetical protein
MNKFVVCGQESIENKMHEGEFENVRAAYSFFFIPFVHHDWTHLGQFAEKWKTYSFIEYSFLSSSSGIHRVVCRAHASSPAFVVVAICRSVRSLHNQATTFKSNPLFRQKCQQLEHEFPSRLTESTGRATNEKIAYAINAFLFFSRDRQVSSSHRKRSRSRFTVKSHL